MNHRSASTFAFRLIQLFALSSLLFASTFAQSSTATLSGHITDENGGLVPGCTVTLLNDATSLKRETSTNDSGFFTVPLLPPGTYRLTASRDGFKTVEVRDITLNVNDERSLRIQMKVGAVTEVVDVTSEQSLIDDSAAVATVVNRQFVANLPLNGRSFQSLITLSPGVVLTKAENFENGQFSVNGQRPNANYFTVDGVSANIGAPTGMLPGQNGGGSLPGLTTFGGTNNLVSVDALQEFKILTSTYAPEYGRTPGGQVSLATRSGTNDFHGSFFNYFRNDALDANDWFANSRSLKRPALRQNWFGGVLGGPVLLPRFGEGGSQPGYNGHNHTFFFFSYEGLRLRQPLVGITSVPSRAARAAAAALPAVQQLLNAFPLPTGADQPSGLAEFAASFSNPSKLNATSLRIDHIFSEKLSVFGRYNDAPSETATRSGDGIRSLNTVRHLRIGTRTFTMGATFSLNSSLLNDLRFNYSRNSNGGLFELDSFGGAIPPPESLLFPTVASPAIGALIVNINPSANVSLFWGNATQNAQRQWNLVDTLSMNRGSHQIKFGVDYRRLSPILSPFVYQQQVSFNGITNTTNGALSGRTQSVNVQNNIGPQYPIVTNLSVYGQDVWKATRRLTLTYGLRWEVNPPPHEANGNEPYALNAVVAPNNLTLAPRGTALWKTTYNNFAPRIGAAYALVKTPGRETVLRGGFGVFYDLGTGSIINAYVGEWPFQASRTTTNLPFPVPAANAAPPTINVNPPATTPIVLFDPHLELPYTLQWNTALEQSIGRYQTLSVSYVGAAGRRLLRQEVIRFGTVTFVNPNFNSSVSLTTNSAESEYRALQIQFERRLSKGLQAIASYTWAKSVDTASNDTSQFSTPLALTNLSRDRAPSDFDVRHTISAAIVYDLPAPNFGGVGNAIFRNWGVDATFNARSATPLNIVTGMFTTTYGLNFFRPNLVAGVPTYLFDSTLPGGKRINPAAFSIPPLGENGDFPRNSLRGFALWQMDLSLRRQFMLKERLKLQFRADIFNILNHPNFGDPTFNDLTFGTFVQASNFFSPPSANFGRSTTMLGRRLGAGGNSGGFNPLYQVGGPRSIQLSLRLMF